MKKLFILSAFLVFALVNVQAQSTYLNNKASATKIKATKKPLYVVDGIMQNPLFEFNMTSLKAGNIEEVKILKSEEAIKLYGIEAINGVILIATKVGKNNPDNIELKSKLTLLNLDKSITTLRDFSFVPNANQTDSITLKTQSRLIFRGIDDTTFNPNEPVYVVDGDKVEKDFISLLNPQSIDSITVLKKNSLLALYGLQAANGVILITTKKSKKPLSTEFEKNHEKN